MARDHAYATTDQAFMASNIFASRLVPAMDNHPDPPQQSSAPEQRECSCFFYPGVSCDLCAPKTPIPSSSSPVGSNPGQTSSDMSKPEHPLRIRIPRRGASSRAADSQAIQVLPTTPSDNVRVKVEESVPPSSVLSHGPFRHPPQLQPTAIENPIDERIPSGLPPEVQIIIDAYISGTPLNVIASRSVIKTRWGVSVPEECAYVYMGFFMVAEVLVRLFFCVPRL